ncbi:hypothetical protein [Marinithermus hydrothermalis]|uniref:hypothetical protein n=1 Tax=Marinithermus hydrothermalis TaxID=186192 RepID=UPI0011D1C5B3|nr:hypothetical protein [Marinithermus hydrothermalis]
MKKGLAVLLVFGLLLMRVTPALSAGERVEEVFPQQREAIIEVVTPNGLPLSDEDLKDARGQWENVVIGAVAGAAFEIYRQITSSDRVRDWGDVARSAAYGAITGAVGGLGGSVLEAFATGRIGAGFIAGGLAGTIEGHTTRKSR